MKTFFSANKVYVVKNKYFFKKKNFFFQLSFATNEQPFGVILNIRKSRIPLKQFLNKIC